MSEAPQPVSAWEDGRWSRRMTFLPLRLLRLLLSLVIPPRHHKTYPTKAGWLVILIAIFIGAAAYNTASNILFLTLALLMASLVLNGILSVSNFRKIRWRIRVPVSIHANRPASLGLELVNERRFMSTCAVYFWMSLHPGDVKKKVRLKQRLEPGQRRVLEWIWTPPRRGSYRVSTEGLSSSFPFGFLLKRVGLKIEQPLLVWPEPVRCPIPPDLSVARRLTGEERKRVGAGTDLLKLRPYRPGDAMHHIHWKAFARTGELIVKELADEGSRGFVLRIQSSSILWEEESRFDRMCGVAVYLAEALFHRDELRGWILDDGPMETIRNRDDLHHFFDRIALLERSDGPLAAAPRLSYPLLDLRPVDKHDIYPVAA